MYQDHKLFVKPENIDLPIWRYLDFTKFVSMLESGALYFTRSDLFNDPYEGYSPALEISKEFSRELLEQYNNIFTRFRSHTYINCWHLNEYESASMWDLYLKSNEGLAVKSTFRMLSESFDQEDKALHIMIGKVRYIDYSKELPPKDNLFGPFTYKRISFEHERELRVVFQDIVKDDLSTSKYEHGTLISIDIDKLIDSIYVAPTAPSWLTELIKRVCDRYGLRKEVIHSKLYDTP